MNQLLTSPSKKIMGHIETVIRSVSHVLPIPSKHQRDLPFAIRDLSRLLTEERGNLSRSYWAAPRYLSAYLYYFLPWNLYRLGFLLPNLDLPLLPGSRILDMGSGPITLPLALWCTRPELRSIPLHFVCSDIAQKPIEVGVDILKDADPETPWTFSVERGPLEKSLSSASTPFHMIMGGNVLNELTAPKGATLSDRVSGIMRTLPKKITKDAIVLLIEPGTRLGGKMISLARKGALSCGFDPIAPCTHSNPCPVIEQSAYYSLAPAFNGWCHFICDVDAAPAKLDALTRKAGFKRQSLALSFLQMSWKKDTEKAAYADPSFDLEDLELLYAESMGEQENIYDEGVKKADTQGKALEQTVKNGSRSKSTIASEVSRQGAALTNSAQFIASGSIESPKSPFAARIISSDIRLASTTGRYACSAAGLLLVTGAHNANFGEKITAKKLLLDRDVKTGSLMATKVIEKEAQPLKQEKPERQQRELFPKEKGAKPSPSFSSKQKGHRVVASKESSDPAAPNRRDNHVNSVQKSQKDKGRDISKGKKYSIEKKEPRVGTAKPKNQRNPQQKKQ